MVVLLSSNKEGIMSFLVKAMWQEQINKEEESVLLLIAPKYNSTEEVRLLELLLAVLMGIPVSHPQRGNYPLQRPS